MTNLKMLVLPLSGLTPAERARSLLLPTTESTAAEAPRERESDSERETMDRETDALPSVVDYLQNQDLYVLQT